MKIFILPLDLLEETKINFNFISHCFRFINFSFLNNFQILVLRIFKLNESSKNIDFDWKKPKNPIKLNLIKIGNFFLFILQLENRAMQLKFFIFFFPFLIVFSFFLENWYRLISFNVRLSVRLRFAGICWNVLLVSGELILLLGFWKHFSVVISMFWLFQNLYNIGKNISVTSILWKLGLYCLLIGWEKKMDKVGVIFFKKYKVKSNNQFQKKSTKIY